MIAERKTARTNQGPVLVLDAGDYSMGTAFGAASREIGGELQIMSLMGYDATTFGNHDFDLGPEGLAESISVAVKAGRIPAVLFSSFGGTPAPSGSKYNMFLAQPFVNYNCGGGSVSWHLSGHHRQLAHVRRQGIDLACGRSGGPRNKARGKIAGKSQILDSTTTRYARNSARPGSSEYKSPLSSEDVPIDRAKMRTPSIQREGETRCPEDRGTPAVPDYTTRFRWRHA